MAKNKFVKNAVALYAMSIVKMILPLVTLPYLTRVLTKECYGVVSYVKAVMQYMQLFVDFGFLLSGTKDIVKAKNDKKMLELETGNIFAARILLGCFAGVMLLLLTTCIPILKENIIYTILSFMVVFLSCFLFDYLFRGLEQMEVITIRFVIMKLSATILTFVFVSEDADILWIPILDIVGSVVAIIWVSYEIKKREIRIRCSSFTMILKKIKESAIYFVSDAATTAFSILNTLLIGIYISEGEVAEWSVCLQLVGAVQALYSPLINSIYPEMVNSRKISIIKKTLKIFMPLVCIGCVFTFIVAKYVLWIIGGIEYIGAEKLLRCLIPVLFFSFPGMLLGWPTLGAIGRVKETTATTIFTATIQVIGLIILITINQFTLIHIAVLRGITEMILFLTRFGFCKKYYVEFEKNN